MELQERIQNLPKEIQNMIYECNPEHRIYTREMNREFKGLIYPPCRVCRSPFKNEFCGIDYFIIYKYKLYSHWCDINCFQNDTDSHIKLKCLNQQNL
jgi:hypothetical protein